MKKKIVDENTWLMMAEAGCYLPSIAVSPRSPPITFEQQREMIWNAMKDWEKDEVKIP